VSGRDYSRGMGDTSVGYPDRLYLAPQESQYYGEAFFGYCSFPLGYILNFIFYLI